MNTTKAIVKYSLYNYYCSLNKTRFLTLHLCIEPKGAGFECRVHGGARILSAYMSLSETAAPADIGAVFVKTEITDYTRYSRIAEHIEVPEDGVTPLLVDPATRRYRILSGKIGGSIKAKAEDIIRYERETGYADIRHIAVHRLLGNNSVKPIIKGIEDRITTSIGTYIVLISRNPEHVKMYPLEDPKIIKKAAMYIRDPLEALTVPLQTLKYLQPLILAETDYTTNVFTEKRNRAIRIELPIKLIEKVLDRLSIKYVELKDIIENKKKLPFKLPEKGYALITPSGIIIYRKNGRRHKILRTIIGHTGIRKTIELKRF